MSIKIHGIFRQDKRFCDKNEICDITFENVAEFKKWVHENCYAVSNKCKYLYFDKELGSIPESICGFLCEDSKYNISHRKGYAKVEIYIITINVKNPKAITNNEDNEDDEDINEDEFPYIEKEAIIYSNGMKTDGNKHFGDKIEKTLEEVNKNDDRSKFYFA